MDHIKNFLSILGFFLLTRKAQGRKLLLLLLSHAIRRTAGN
jgi:hypothetical protein